MEKDTEVEKRRSELEQKVRKLYDQLGIITVKIDSPPETNVPCFIKTVDLGNSDVYYIASLRQLTKEEGEKVLELDYLLYALCVIKHYDGKLIIRDRATHKVQESYKDYIKYSTRPLLVNPFGEKDIRLSDPNPAGYQDWIILEEGLPAYEKDAKKLFKYFKYVSLAKNMGKDTKVEKQQVQESSNQHKRREK